MDANIVARKALAEKAALVGLAAILTHDLSNPLQSVTVLSELGLEEEEPAESIRRARQCLEAAERMRTLIHSYASLTRNLDRGGPIVESVQRLMPLFQRRFERHRILLDLDLEGREVGPPAFEFVILAVFLGIVDIASQASSEALSGAIRVRGAAVDIPLAHESGQCASWPQDVVDDLQAMLADSGGTALADDEGLHLRMGTGS